MRRLPTVVPLKLTVFYLTIGKIVSSSAILVLVQNALYRYRYIMYRYRRCLHYP